MIKMKTDQDTLKAIIRLMLDEAGMGKSIAPTAIAKRAGGDPTKTSAWRPLLRNVGRAAAMLQASGELLALRKGNPVDIKEAKGILRYTLPPVEDPQDEPAAVSPGIKDPSSTE
jgi:hypothetical protein